MVDHSSPVTTSEQQAVPVAQEKAYRSAGEVSNDATSHLAIRSPLNRVIYKAVRDYRLSNMAYADDQGGAYPLVDLMSNPAPSDIGTGEMEMISLVDEIQIAIEAAGLSVPLPCKSGEGAGEAFLDQLRRVNLARYEAWVEGADAGIMFDALELGGEVGELLNVVKKLEREERGWRGSRAAPEDFADECADVLICLDKLARRRNVDLAAVTISKFNATSEKVGLPHRLEASLGSGAPAEQEVSVSVAEGIEPRPVGDPKIIQVEDRAGSQREAEGVPRDHAREDSRDTQTREAVLAQAVANILPIGDDRAPGDRVIPIYVRMDELRALRELAALSARDPA